MKHYSTSYIEPNIYFQHYAGGITLVPRERVSNNAVGATLMLNANIYLINTYRTSFGGRQKSFYHSADVKKC